jgi:hypothetical protein
MSSLIVAKTCGCNVGESDSSFILESYETFCVDKKNIIVAQLDSCDMLLKYTADKKERKL